MNRTEIFQRNSLYYILQKNLSILGFYGSDFVIGGSLPYETHEPSFASKFNRIKFTFDHLLYKQFSKDQFFH